MSMIFYTSRSRFWRTRPFNGVYPTLPHETFFTFGRQILPTTILGLSSFLASIKPVTAQETIRQCLSGTDAEHIVPWGFFCSDGRASGAWTNIACRYAGNCRVSENSVTASRTKTTRSSTATTAISLMSPPTGAARAFSSCSIHHTIGYRAISRHGLSSLRACDRHGGKINPNDL